MYRHYDDESKFAWTIALNHAFATGGDVRYDLSGKSLDEAVGYVNRDDYLDYNHLNLSNLYFGIDNFVYRDGYIAFGVNNLTAQERNSTLTIEHFQTHFLMDGELITAKDIDFKMPDSKINGDFSIDLSLLDTLGQGSLNSSLTGMLSSSDLISIVTPYIPSFEQYWPKEQTSFTTDVFLSRDTSISRFCLVFANIQIFWSKIRCLSFTMRWRQ